MTTRDNVNAVVRIFILLVFLSNLAYGTTTVVGVSPASKQVLPLATFSLDITVTDVVKLHAASVKFTFDNSLIQYTGVTQGAFLTSNGDATFFSSSPAAGPGVTTVTVDQAILGLGKVSGSGVLFTINFTALSPGISPVNLITVDLRDTTNSFIASASENGQVEIVIPLFSVAPGSISYGDVVVGLGKTDSVTVTNNGTADLHITSATPTDHFTIDPTSGTVPPSGSLKFKITFSPIGIGLQTGSVSFVHDAAGSPSTVSLDGNGVASTFSVLPTSLSFGDVVAGWHKEDSVTVKNTGTADLHISLVDPTNGKFSVLPLNGTIVPSDSMKFKITFSPTGAGPQSGNITFTHDAAGSPSNVAVSGNGLPATYAITATAGPNGSINPSGSVIVDYGLDTTFTISPNTGYNIDSLIIDGVSQPVASSYTFHNVTATHTIRVVFIIKKYVVNITALNGGVDKLPNLALFDSNTTVQLTAMPATGFHFLSWDGDVSGTTNPVNLLMNSDKNVTAHFGIDTFTIVGSAGTHGSISPSGPVIVTYGSAQTFNLIPSSGYAVDSIFIDGVGQAGAPSYSFTAINANHTISVTFIILPSYAARYRSFVYEDLVEKKALRKKNISEYWEFQIINTTGATVNEVNIRFNRNVSEIIETGGLEYSGFKRDYVLSGPFAAGDTIILTGRSPWASNIDSRLIRHHQLIEKLWLGSKRAIPTARNILPTTLIGELPMPNAANVRDEIFALTLRPSGGLVVGIVETEHRTQYGWVRMKRSWDMFRSLFDKNAGLHVVINRGFMVFNNGRPFIREQAYLSPAKQNNKTFADLMTLKFNIVLSAFGMTPRGFGELRYVEAGSPFVNMLVKDIAALGDSMMTYARGTQFLAHPEWYGKLDTTLMHINSVFSAPIDTISWSDSLRLTGTIRVIDSGILTPTSEAPAILAPITTDNGNAELPVTTQLYQNYPNPFNPTTNIQFDLSTQMIVTLKVYNILGQEVATLLEHEEMFEGNQEVQFDASSLASGVYFYRITAQAAADEDGIITGKDFISVKKMVLVK